MTTTSEDVYLVDPDLSFEGSGQLFFDSVGLLDQFGSIFDGYEGSGSRITFGPPGGLLRPLANDKLARRLRRKVALGRNGAF